jgi:hypothetical protein
MDLQKQVASEAPRETDRVVLIPHRKFAEQHGVCGRTLDRWTEIGLLPEPRRINQRKYWPVGTSPKVAK